MPRKRRATTVRRKTVRRPKMLVPMQGEGWLGDAWDWVKNAGKKVLSNVKPSQVLGLIPHPAAQGAATAARVVGMGGRRRRMAGGANGSMAGRLYII